jgi:hypothetical protein
MMEPLDLECAFFLAKQMPLTEEKRRWLWISRVLENQDTAALIDVQKLRAKAQRALANYPVLSEEWDDFVEAHPEI